LLRTNTRFPLVPQDLPKHALRDKEAKSPITKGQ
jgi:hypothetical protein